MRSQIGASYVARAGNGSTPASRRFSEEVLPPVKLWAEAVAVLAAGLSAIVRNPDQASTIAMATLHRAGEAVPTIMRSPEIRAALAIAATLAEDREIITQPAVLPVAPPPMPAPVPTLAVASGPIPTSPPSAPDPSAAPAPAVADLLRHDPPAPLGVAELRARIAILEQRRAAAQARGDKTNARTIRSALTKTRKRLRAIKGTSGGDLN
jgi:uncharacterized small protein (DUF1192 family)